MAPGSGTSSSSYVVLAKEVAVAWLVCSPVALAIGWVAGHLLASTDISQVPKLQTWPQRFSAVVVGPLLESMLMAVVFAVLERLLPQRVSSGHRMMLLTLFSAFFWSVAHGLVAMGWGVVTFWPFVVFSFMFLRWERQGLTQGIAAAALVHALHNGTAAILGIVLG